MIPAASTDCFLDGWPFRYYGRRVSPLGEDSEDGVMVEGHDRRAAAAINAHRRETMGPPWRAQDGYPQPELERLTVRFTETCGCTPEQHAEHVDEQGLPDECPCELWGLPPCDPDRFEWRYVNADEGDPDAVPVSVVRW